MRLQSIKRTLSAVLYSGRTNQTRIVLVEERM